MPYARPNYQQQGSYYPRSSPGSYCCGGSSWPWWYGTGTSPFSLGLGTGLSVGWPFGGTNFGTGFNFDLG